MNRQNRRRFEVFVRVCDFGARHQAQFPAGSRCQELLADLEQVINEIETADAHRVQETSNKSQLTSGRANARDEVINGMTAISRTARSIGRARKGFEQKFRMPPRGSDQSLLAAARAFAAALEPLQAEFIREEMAADFLPRFQESIVTFAGIINTQISARAVQSEAGDEVTRGVAAGMDIIHRLNGPMYNRIGDNAALVIQWEKATRQERAAKLTSGSGAASGEDNGDTPAAA
ncbi:MAG: hypothetical protein ACKV2V_10910 [Blastocatellia bacterium]